MTRLHHCNVFTDLGEHHVFGDNLGDIDDMDLIHTASGTQMIASSGGCIYTFLQKDGTTTGNLTIKTNIITAACTILKAGALRSDGSGEKITILGAVGKTVQVMEQSGDNILPPKPASVVAPVDTVSIVKYYPLSCTTGYKLATVYANSDGQSYSVGYSEWTNGKPILTMDAGIVMSSSAVHWVKQGSEDCVLVQFNGEYYILNPKSSFDSKHKISMQHFHEENKGKLISAYQNIYFMLSEDGVISAYDLEGLESNGSCLWKTATGVNSIIEIQAIQAYGCLHILAFSKEERTIFHCPVLYATDGQMNDSIPMINEVHEYRTDAGENELHVSVMTGDDAKPKLLHLELSQDGRAWSERRVCLESENEIHTVTGHIIEITCCDQDNAPIAGCQTQLWTSEDTTLRIQNNVLHIGPKIPYLLQANDMGCIEIIQEGDSMNGVEIILRQTDEDKKPMGSYFLVTPEEKYKNTFREMSKQQMSTAVTSTGEKLVPADLCEEREEVIGHATDAMKNMMSGIQLTDNLELQKIRENDWHPDKANAMKVTSYFADPTSYLKGKAPKVVMKSCQICFVGNKLTYKSMLPEEAMQCIQHSHSEVYGTNRMFRLPVKGGKDSIFSAIASFFKAIKKALISVVEIIVHAVETAVTAMVRFIDKAVERIVHFTVQLVKDVVHLVETVLEQIKVGFQKIIQWIGFIFDWRDILRTAKEMKRRIDVGFDRAEKGLDEAKQFADTNLDKAEAWIRQAFQQFTTKLPNESIKDNTNCPLEDTPIMQADAHNPVKKHIGSKGSNCKMSFVMGADEQAALKVFELAAEEFSFSDSLSFQTLLDGAKKSDFSIRSVGNIMMGMMETLIEALIHAAKAVLGKLFDAAKILLRWIQKMAEQPIYIPILSALIKKCTGMDLTIVNVASLFIAIPTTIAYKLIYHEAPLKEGKKETVRNSGALNKVFTVIGNLMINFSQTVMGGMLCAKLVTPLFLPAILELMGIALFCGMQSSHMGVWHILLFAIATSQGILNCAYSVGGFPRKATFYRMKGIASVVGLIMSCGALIDKQEPLRIIVSPGGILFGAQEALLCMYYRTRAGELKEAVAVMFVLSILSAVLTALMPDAAPNEALT